MGKRSVSMFLIDISLFLLLGTLIVACTVKKEKIKERHNHNRTLLKRTVGGKRKDTGHRHRTSTIPPRDKSSLHAPTVKNGNSLSAVEPNGRIKIGYRLSPSVKKGEIVAPKATVTPAVNTRKPINEAISEGIILDPTYFKNGGNLDSKSPKNQKLAEELQQFIDNPGLGSNETSTLTDDNDVPRHITIQMSHA